MSKIKIFNDPVHGIIAFKHEILYDIIDHPYFQRLRHIKQMGLSNLVYPGANHTRFEHALGALHLMHRALDMLSNKGVNISEEEYIASCIAVLSHDLGHGPYSHALEGLLLPVDHEHVTRILMEDLAKEFGAIILIAIEIFNGSYSKKFLCQLVSSQVDVDRLDYLTRDSFYTGVVEGKVGFDRILFMMNVVDGDLVIEEKGMSSIEKFLLSRQMMYSQVYLHKTALSGEEMLKIFIKRCVSLLLEGHEVKATQFFTDLVYFSYSAEYNLYTAINQFFIKLDDSDILYLIKSNTEHEDSLVKIMSKSLHLRKLFKLYLPLENENVGLDHPSEVLNIESKVSVKIYEKELNQIKILLKNGGVKELSEVSDALPINLNKIESVFFRLAL